MESRRLPGSRNGRSRRLGRRQLARCMRRWCWSSRGRNGNGRSVVAGDAARQRGAYAVEFLIVLMGSLSLFVPLAEFLRISLFDQALARATQQAARAAASAPAGQCLARVTGVFQPRAGETLIGWLLDLDGDGRVVVQDGAGWPAAGSEVQVASSGASELGPTVGPWSWGACGSGGALTLLRARMVVPYWSGFTRAVLGNGLPREHVSWAAG